jgi:hypothetical protein
MHNVFLRYIKPRGLGVLFLILFLSLSFLTDVNPMGASPMDSNSHSPLTNKHLLSPVCVTTGGI